MKCPSCLLALSLITAFAGKVICASTIDFDNTPSGAYVTSPITQAGFTYSAYSGSIYIDGYGTYSGAGASHDLSGGAIGGVAEFRASRDNLPSAVWTLPLSPAPRQLR